MVRKKVPSMPSTGTPEEAEEFMGLLLAAQSAEHDCPWCGYFRKMGDRLKTQYVKE